MGERLRQLDPREPSSAISASLATFHTTLFVLIVLSLVYAFGDLGDELDDLNTFAGLGLFVYLWVIVWITTAGALRRMGWPETAGFEATTDAAFRWGAVTGAAILLVAGGALIVGAATYSALVLDVDGLLAAMIFIPFVLIGGAFALAFGAVFGGLFGLVDYVLLRLSESVLDSVSPSDVRADR